MPKVNKDVEKTVNAFLTARERVIEIYELYGPGHERNPIICPMCEEETLNYWCNWGDNDHVHLHCTSCNWAVMQ